MLEGPRFLYSVRKHPLPWLCYYIVAIVAMFFFWNIFIVPTSNWAVSTLGWLVGQIIVMLAFVPTVLLCTKKPTDSSMASEEPGIKECHSEQS